MLMYEKLVVIVEPGRNWRGAYGYLSLAQAL
jgi:hypothetical protein